jgi:hypothetical protein
MTLVESIIAIIVVFVVIAAVLTTVAMSAQMIGSARSDLGIHTLAANWFEALEAQDPDALSGDFSGAVRNATKAIDPLATGSGMSYEVGGYTLTAERNTPNNGVVTVSVLIRSSSGSNWQGARFEKIFNTFSNATVNNGYAQAGFEG